ncbi:hypothetical protein L7F22_040789 [Adiantum nelumboides]|nr:hypothetical protein [Adiantum nelumboides]
MLPGEVLRFQTGFYRIRICCYSFRGFGRLTRSHHPLQQMFWPHALQTRVGYAEKFQSCIKEIVSRERALRAPLRSTQCIRQDSPRDSYFSRRHIELTAELRRLQEMRFEFSHHASVSYWISTADRMNRDFFAIHRERPEGSTMRAIRDGSGAFHTDPDQVVAIATDFYKNLFNAETLIDEILEAREQIWSDTHSRVTDGSALLIGRFLTSTPWGIIADKYGHKVVIYFGTATIFTFNTVFGFSTNYWMALTSRFLLGLGNGLTGTLAAYACEICRQEHQAVAMSIMGTMWGFGLIVGPAIGGYLAEHSQKLPTLFPSESLFDRYPYALPCVFISAIAVAAFFLSFLLPETRHNHAINSVTFEEKILKASGKDICNEGIPVSKQSLWNNWGLLASVTFISCWVIQATAYSETFSLWAVSPTSYGGLVFTSSEVAHVLAVSGAAILLFQLLLFPLFANRVGAIQLVRISALLTSILVVLYPLFHKLQGAMLWTILLLVSAAKNILSVSGFTGSYIIINNSVENSQRGVANGLSASIMSAFQAFAPAFAGAMFSLGEERVDASYLPGMWMVFSILGVFSFLAFIATFKPFLPSSLNQPLSRG